MPDLAPFEPEDCDLLSGLDSGLLWDWPEDAPPDLAASSTDSPSAARIRIASPTAICWPSSAASLATVPSSKAWSSIVALSVSMSASTSPDDTLSPTLTFHLTTVPCSMVSDKRGMVTGIGMTNSIGL